MPAQVRSKEADKILWKILPVPLNLVEKKTEKQKVIDQRINLAWIARQR